MTFDISIIQQIREGIQKNTQLICFSIGATYLQERYESEARGTDDIDFVVIGKGNINETKLENRIIKQMQTLDCKIYSESNNPLCFKTGRNVRVHIYTFTIGEFEISQEMIERSSDNHRFSIEDYVFLKLLPSEREKDKDDIIFALQKNPDFNWKILLFELKSQLRNYEKKFGTGPTYNKVLEIGYTLERISDEHPELVSQEKMDMITQLLNFFNSQLKG